MAALPAAALDEMRASAIRRLEELCFHDFRISDEYRRLVKQARKEHASRKRARAADGRHSGLGGFTLAGLRGRRHSARRSHTSTASRDASQTDSGGAASLPPPTPQPAAQPSPRGPRSGGATASPNGAGGLFAAATCAATLLNRVRRTTLGTEVNACSSGFAQDDWDGDATQPRRRSLTSCELPGAHDARPGAVSAAPPAHKPVAEKLSDVTFLSSVKVDVGSLGKSEAEGGGPWWEMVSISEKKVSSLVRENRAQLCKYNARQLSRVYPGGGGAAGLRLDSSNPPPSEVVCAAWASGCQMVALNFQRWDEAMQINHDLFRLNAGCGYVLKPKLSPHVGLGLGEKEHLAPHERQERGGSPSAPTCEPTKLKMIVFSAHNLPKRDGERCARFDDEWGRQERRWDEFHCKAEFEKEELRAGDVANPQVTVEVVGGLVTPLVQDERVAKEEQWRERRPTHKAEGVVQHGNGLMPQFATWDGGDQEMRDWELKWLLWQPEHTFLRLCVHSQKRNRFGRVTTTLLAYAVLPVWALRQGYRSIPLRSPSGGAPIVNCALFVFLRHGPCPLQYTPPPPPPADAPRPPPVRLAEGSLVQERVGSEAAGRGRSATESLPGVHAAETSAALPSPRGQPRAAAAAAEAAAAAAAAVESVEHSVQRGWAGLRGRATELRQAFEASVGTHGGRQRATTDDSVATVALASAAARRRQRRLGGGAPNDGGGGTPPQVGTPPPEAATPEVDYELTPPPKKATPPEAESAAEPTAPPTKTYSREEILGALTQLERMSDAEIAAIADAHDEPFPDEPFPDEPFPDEQERAATLGDEIALDEERAAPGTPPGAPPLDV